MIIDSEIYPFRMKFHELILHTQIHIANPIQIIYCDSDSIIFEEIPLLTNGKT